MANRPLHGGRRAPGAGSHSDQSGLLVDVELKTRSQSGTGTGSQLGGTRLQARSLRTTEIHEHQNTRTPQHHNTTTPQHEPFKSKPHPQQRPAPCSTRCALPLRRREREREHPNVVVPSSRHHLAELQAAPKSLSGSRWTAQNGLRVPDT